MIHARLVHVSPASLLAAPGAADLYSMVSDGDNQALWSRDSRGLSMLLVPAPRGTVKPPPARRDRPVTARPGGGMAGRHLRRRLGEPIQRRWAGPGVLALIGANVAGAVLEPPPANPNAPEPWFIVLLSVVLLLAMLAALSGLLARRRWGMALSLVAASTAVVMVTACPLSGHHRFGFWWVGELAAMAAWTAVSAAGLRSTPASR
jgi:hypothetical protein